MRVNSLNGLSPSFGIKFPTKRVLEVATGRFLEDAKISHPAQVDMLQKVGNLSHEQVYSYQMGEALRNMSKVIRTRHPEIAKSADRIGKECDILNRERTFLPKDEIVVKQKIDDVVNEELVKIGKDEIDVAPMSLKELGYDKSDILAQFKNKK